MKKKLLCALIILFSLTQNLYAQKKDAPPQTAMDLALEVIKKEVIKEVLKRPRISGFDEISLDILPSTQEGGESVTNVKAKNLNIETSFDLNIDNLVIQDIQDMQETITVTMRTDKTKKVIMKISSPDLQIFYVSFADDNNLNASVYIAINSKKSDIYSMYLNKMSFKFVAPLGDGQYESPEAISAYSFSGQCDARRKVEDSKKPKQMKDVDVICEYSMKIKSTEEEVTPEIHFKLKEKKN